MKKFFSVLAASVLLAGSAYAAAPQTKTASVSTDKAAQPVRKAAKTSEDSRFGNYSLESFSCCGLPQ
jgi:hypothetical protein